MSSYICEHCGKEIIEGPDGWYITECEHWPLERRKEVSNFVPPKQLYPHPCEKKDSDVTNYVEVEKISEKRWCPECGAKMWKGVRWYCPQCGCEKCG